MRSSSKNKILSAVLILWVVNAIQWDQPSEVEIMVYNFEQDLTQINLLIGDYSESTLAWALSSFTRVNLETFSGYTIQFDYSNKIKPIITFKFVQQQQGQFYIFFTAFNLNRNVSPNMEVVILNAKVNLPSRLSSKNLKIKDIQTYILDMPSVEAQSGGSYIIDMKKTIVRVSDREFDISFESSFIKEINFSVIIIYESDGDILIDTLFSSQIISDTNAVNSNKFIVPNTQSFSCDLIFGFHFGINNFNIQLSNSLINFELLIDCFPEGLGVDYQISKNNGELDHTVSNYLNAGFILFFQNNDCTKIINISPTFQKTCESECNNKNLNFSVRKYFDSEPFVYNICYSCNNDCEECEDRYPNKCLDRYEINYYNSVTKKYLPDQPQRFACKYLKKKSNKQYFYCEPCGPSCEECSFINNQNVCLSCIRSAVKNYLYNNQCLTSQPESTYCDNNNICTDCHLNCESCVNSSNFCTKCKVNKFFYNNQCLDSKPPQAYCVYRSKY